jgi:PKD repeat protein
LPRKLLRTVVRCSFVLALSGAAAAFASTSTAPSPIVTFGTPGTKQVTLQACNNGSCNTIVKSVTVLDPMPAVTNVGATPNPASTGDVLHLTGAGTGQPPLTFTWRILNVVGTQIGAAAGAAADWTATVPPGVYSVYLDLGNAHGSNTSLPAVVTVAASPAYIFMDGFEQGSTAVWLSSPP